MYARRIKPALDLAVSFLTLPLLLPLIGILALLVRINMGSPVLFRQSRPGYMERPFVVFKLRTMTDEKDAHGNLLPDGLRLTRLGRFLRLTSFDELPQFFNILRGEMSFIGPRPLLERYLPYYTEEERLRHSVRPGITGWAQIHGRNDVPITQRLALDVWYARNLSWQIDLKIFFLTTWQI